MKRSMRVLTLLAAFTTWAGCSSGGGEQGDGGTGGAGATGGSGPISFDAENALPVSSGNAIAIAVASDLGGIVGNAIGALSEAAVQGSVGVGPKADSDLDCPGGGMVKLSYNVVADGEEATLTFTGCVGSTFSNQAIDGTIVLAIEAVDSSGFKPIPSEGTATVSLTAGSDTTIAGSFKMLASLTGTSLELTFGNQLGTDLLTITRAGQSIELGCFKIRQVIELRTGTFGGTFEPVGVARLNGTQIFTINDYTQAPPIIVIEGPTVTSGEVDMSSGDKIATATSINLPFCTPFGNTPAGDNSIISNEFRGESCVQVTGQDASGNPIDFETTYGKLLNADFTPGGATCEGSTPAMPGPVGDDACDIGGTDRFPYADTYVTGDGPEPDRRLADTNFGSAPNLLAKSVFNLGFTRKIYMVFDIADVTAPVTKATLVLTLERHVQADVPEESGPQPFNFYGVRDGNDWDGDTPPETGDEGLTWNNAITCCKNVNDWRIPFTETGTSVEIAGYDFKLGGDFDQDNDGVDDPGTRYAFDLTDYVNDRIDNDADGRITILIAHFNPTTANVNTSTFFSKEHAEVECNRPFLRLE